MSSTGAFEVIRDPLWNNIRVDREALAVLDSEAFQRLRYVRQLGHAYLVYPGATHTRFEHALGTYHLARRALALFGDRGELEGIDGDELATIRLAALLHDVGHYPFSHALEEAGLASHEEVARDHFNRPQLRDALRRVDIDDLPHRLASLIGGTSASPLQGLVAGSLDLDKIEYLTRDARMCGVPYGTVDVDRLLNSLAIVPLEDGSQRIGVHAKGLSALESLLFAKYQMYRNVYWHHAVRSATAMFKRLVRTAIRQGVLEATWIPFSTDEELMERLRGLTGSDLVERLRRRRLFKRVVDAPAEFVPPGTGTWIAGDPDLAERVEDTLARKAGLAPGELLLDYPAKPAMLAVDLPILSRDGRVEQMAGQRAAMLLGTQRVADQLHTLARRLRVFVARPVELTLDDVLDLVRQPPEELRTALETP